LKSFSGRVYNQVLVILLKNRSHFGRNKLSFFDNI
jgi:hypothetical protein